MAAVALQPVVVDSPAGAPTSGCPIFLAANSEAVSSTPGLDWQPAPAGPGGAARVQLMTFQAVKAFLPRCKISRIPADLAAANAVNALTVRLTDACWSRILTELTSAQVFTRTANSIDELHDFLKEANIPTPANLDLVAGDWRNAEAFALPAGGAAAAVAARALLTPIRFLTLLAVPSVEEPAAPLPLGLLCTIIGSLGPCLTQASRRTETSTVQLTTSTLRIHLAATAPTDGLLAVKVAPFFRSKQLPFQLRGLGVTETELREELEDGIEYKRSDQGKLAIEEKRIHLLATGCAAPRIACSPVARHGSAPPPSSTRLHRRSNRLRTLRRACAIAACTKAPRSAPRGFWPMRIDPMIHRSPHAYPIGPRLAPCVREPQSHSVPRSAPLQLALKVPRSAPRGFRPMRTRGLGPMRNDLRIHSSPRACPIGPRSAPCAREPLLREPQ